MEEITDGKAIILNYKCNVCGLGYIHYTGIVDPDQAPNIYQNKCEHCENITFNDKDYTTTRIVPMDAEEET